MSGCFGTGYAQARKVVRSSGWLFSPSARHLFGKALAACPELFDQGARPTSSCMEFGSHYIIVSLLGFRVVCVTYKAISCILATDASGPFRSTLDTLQGLKL